MSIFFLFLRLHGVWGLLIFSTPSLGVGFNLHFGEKIGRDYRADYESGLKVQWIDDEGKSNKQIALTLGISGSTVEFHLKNVYAKLDVHSRAEAILKLGKSTGLMDEELRESIVEVSSEKKNNSGISSFKEFEMKKRLFYYFLAGLVFGAAY